MSKRDRLLFAAAIVHLGFVILGAASFPLRDLKIVGRPLSFYADFTGASSGYAFFAPGVGDDIRALFEIKKADGSVVTEKLQRGNTHEGDLRISNIVGKFWEEVDDEARRRAMTASWAAKMFARFPDAKSVAVNVQSYELPSMKEFGEKSASWKPLYSAKFVKH